MKLFVDNLTNSDFSYLHHSRGLLGETWLSHIELEGGLDDQGMVCDFGIVKSTVRDLLDDLIDHRLLVPGRAKNGVLCEVLDDLDYTQRHRTTWTLNSGEIIFHESPLAAVTVIDSEEITRESVSRWCEAKLKQLLPDTIQTIKVSFSTEKIDGAFYHYSHGLKKHNGKCQRIAHGHRSKIEIQRNEKRDSELEAQWANHLKDTYIGTQSDLIETSSIKASNKSTENHHFSYESPEGRFELSLPKSHCYVIDQDTTVENITHHIAMTIKQKSLADNISVKGFEGISKGAIVAL
ncbi:MAG: 6-carboxytetrahydropterin synthase [Cellvibrionaceae bacterium]